MLSADDEYGQTHVYWREAGCRMLPERYTTTSAHRSCSVTELLLFPSSNVPICDEGFASRSDASWQSKGAALVSGGKARERRAAPK